MFAAEALPFFIFSSTAQGSRTGNEGPVTVNLA